MIRRRREKVFGPGRAMPLDRNAKARILAYAKAWSASRASTKARSPAPSWRYWRHCYGASRIVKRYAAAVGLDPAEFSGHSLRSGFLTSAAEAGASVFKMMECQIASNSDPLFAPNRDP